MQAAKTSSNLAMLLIRIMKYGEMACVTFYDLKFRAKNKKVLRIKLKLILTFEGKISSHIQQDLLEKVPKTMKGCVIQIVNCCAK